MRIGLQQSGDKPYLFQKGHPRYGGRQKGSKNIFDGDLRQAIWEAAIETGWLTVDDEGKRVATGEGGVKGFLKWLNVNEPKTGAALLARILPYFITSTDIPDVASRAEIEAQFRELGLPMGLIEYLQRAPAPLDLDEVDDPYGVGFYGGAHRAPLRAVMPKFLSATLNFSSGRRRR
jgi:hypothetical protein